MAGMDGYGVCRGSCGGGRGRAGRTQERLDAPLVFHRSPTAPLRHAGNFITDLEQNGTRLAIDGRVLTNIAGFLGGRHRPPHYTALGQRLFFWLVVSYFDPTGFRFHGEGPNTPVPLALGAASSSFAASHDHEPFVLHAERPRPKQPLFCGSSNWECSPARVVRGKGAVYVVVDANGPDFFFFSWKLQSYVALGPLATSVAFGTVAQLFRGPKSRSGAISILRKKCWLSQATAAHSSSILEVSRNLIHASQQAPD